MAQPTAPALHPVPDTLPLIEVRNLVVNFDTEDGVVEAVKDVSFQILPGETLAIVGESGSGKSVNSLAIMGLLPWPPARIIGGELPFRTRDSQRRDLLTLGEGRLRDIRGNEIAMIFQEPTTGLNPVYTVGDQRAEAVMWP